MNHRERLSSRLGFILLSAGCAIGCGNVWKFPWMAGQYGGGHRAVRGSRGCPGINYAGSGHRIYRYAEYDRQTA